MKRTTKGIAYLAIGCLAITTTSTNPIRTIEAFSLSTTFGIRVRNSRCSAEAAAQSNEHPPVENFLSIPSHADGRQKSLDPNRKHLHATASSHHGSSTSSCALSHSQVLWSYVHNLQRARRSQHRPVGRANEKNPAKSLLAFLRNCNYTINNTVSPSSHTVAATSTFAAATSASSRHDVVEPLTRAVIQAIRFASQVGDYKLIHHLVEASIAYAQDQRILRPRLFGEAINGIAKTGANLSKIKQLWKLAISQEATSCLSKPLGAFELNVMIQALASRGKVGSALNLYHQHTDGLFVSHSGQQGYQDEKQLIHSYSQAQKSSYAVPIIVPDAYTLTSLFTIMDESISEDQAAVLHTTQPNNSATNDKNYGASVEVDSNITGITSKMTSFCWQWNQAIELLHQYVRHLQDDPTASLPPLNNHVFASLLKLNGKASQAFAPKHNGPDMALFVLDLMQELDIAPDVVTCSLIIKDFGDQWRSAVALLQSMKSASISNSSWRLPAPNVYTYSAVIATCARCHQYELVTQLLDELRINEHQGGGPPNAWVYNAALLATTGCESMAVLASNPTTSLQEKPTKQAKRKERLLMALRLFQQMEEDFENGSNTSPDTVTFNTILVALNGIEQIDSVADQQLYLLAHEHFDAEIASPESNRSSILLQERLVNSILDRMKEKNIMRDSITYRNAIIAVRTCGRFATSRVLDQAVSDSDCILQVALSGSPNARQLDGRAAEGLSFVFDTALSLMAPQGDVEGVITTLSKMLAQDIAATNETSNHLMTALGRGYSSPAIPILVRALGGSAEAKYELHQQYDIPEDVISMLTWDKASHYSIAISECLAADDIETTREVLTIMHENGVRPTDLSLQEIARAYSHLAIKAAAREAKWERNQLRRKQRARKGPSNRVSQPYLRRTSRARAKSAYNIAMNIVKDPTPALLSTVARACANCGLWEQARFILRTIHKNILDSDDSTHVLKGSSRRVVRGLHKALLRASSIQGNVTAALWFVDDIQKLSTRLTKRKEQQEELPQHVVSTFNHQDHGNFMSLEQSEFGAPEMDLGMKLEDWKLLLIAASKCGHWRVCLSTLQFLRPYLEATNPALANGAIERSAFKRQYEEIAPALTVAVKCLEIRSQYGWALRAIDDWFEWSGRRPPRAAVLAAIRILAARSRPTEVHKLLTRCITHEAGWTNSSPNSNNSSNTYEAMLYVGAITALHNEGLYDDADDAFCAAISRGALPFLLTNIEIDGVPRMVLDLHGMNLPVAHSAVRVALQQEVESASWNKTGGITSVKGFSLWNDDMIIVTGRGLNSALRMRPILRPEVQRMLVEEFYPPLNTVSVPGNMGAVQVAAEDISAWLSHQRRQKGARMLAVAAVLKNVSSLDRLRERLAQSFEKEENSG